MLLASKFEEICPPEVQDFVHFTDVAYTKTSSVNGYLVACRPGIPQSDSHGCPFLVRVERVVRGDARQRFLDHYLIELTLIDYSVSRHLPSHLACLAVIISNCFFSCPCAQQSQVRSLSQKCYGNGYLGQTETRRREAWLVSSFPGGVVPLHNVALTPSVRTRVGSGEAGSPSVDW